MFSSASLFTRPALTGRPLVQRKGGQVTYRTPPIATTAPAAAPAVVAVPVATEGRVLGLGEPGSWDDGAVGAPVVRCYIGDNEQRWFMWYSGRTATEPSVDVVAPSSGSIGVAVSTDGIHWARGSHEVEGARGKQAAGDVGSMIMPNKDWWTFDTCHVAPSDIQVLSNGNVSHGIGVYWMFYSGGDFEPVPLPEVLPGAAKGASLEGLRMRPGLAMSQDGRNWARIEGDHHTGALFDVGKPGEFDQLFIASPQVLNVAPRDMRMYYTTWDLQRGRFVVGMAVSPDGFRWTKKGAVFDPAALAGQPQDDAPAFDALGAATVNVVRDFDNRQFVMFYEAVGVDNGRCIAMAVSKDGTTWSRCPQPVLQRAAPPAASGIDDDAGSLGTAAVPEPWDGGCVGAPCGVSMSAGKWRLYYAGRRRGASGGPWEGIGMAKSVKDGSTFQGVPMQYRRGQA